MFILMFVIYLNNKNECICTKQHNNTLNGNILQINCLCVYVAMNFTS